MSRICSLQTVEPVGRPHNPPAASNISKGVKTLSGAVAPLPPGPATSPPIGSFANCGLDGLRSGLRGVAAALVTGLTRELNLTPKPGLVDQWDNGSHADLSYGLMRGSIALLDGCFAEYCAALESGATVQELRAIGRAAELRMFGCFGTNTHRGAIFLGGVLLAAVHRAPGEGEMAVRRALGAVARELFAEQLPQATKGARVRAGYGVGGVVAEVLNGLPSVFEAGLPALRHGRALGLGADETLLLAMARLMQTVEDTTALRRCGPRGLERLKVDGARLETLLLDGANPMPFLLRTNRVYRSWHLTMGGVADLLGVCAGWDRYGSA